MANTTTPLDYAQNLELCIECGSARPDVKLHTMTDEPPEKQLARVLNERVEVEDILAKMAAGKLSMPDKRDLQVLSIMLGTPKKLRSDSIKNHKWRTNSD